MFAPVSAAVMRLAPRAAVACAMSALLAAPAAQAVVVTSPAANVPVPVTTSGIYINVLTGAAGTAAGTAGWDVNPWGSSSFQIWGNTGGGIATNGTAIAALAAGTVVGPALTFTSSGSGASAANGWVLNSANYFGFSFINEASGGLHYGYGIVQLGGTFTDPARSVVSLFYESVANTPITIAAVPEASTWAMMLSGLAVAGAIARRRRAG